MMNAGEQGTWRVEQSRWQWNGIVGDAPWYRDALDDVHYATDADLNTLEAERGRLEAALRKIESGWKYPPGPGMRPPPEPLGRDAMRRIAAEALEALSSTTKGASDA